MKSQENKKLDKCTLLEAIKKRYSCRTYEKKPVPEDVLKDLLEYQHNLMQNEKFFNDVSIRVYHVEGEFWDYFVQGAQSFLAIIAPKNCHRDVLMKCGFLLQKIVLHATTLGLGTVWVGGRFLSNKIAQHLKEKPRDDVKYSHNEDAVVCVLPFGIKSWSVAEKIGAFIVGSRRRHSPKKLFFEEKFGQRLTIDVKFEDLFEAFRWAPSAVNRQTSKIVKCGEEFHFFSYPTTQFYSSVNMGISLANWDVILKEKNISGEFVKREEEDIKIEKIPNGATYFLTWVYKEN